MDTENKLGFIKNKKLIGGFIALLLIIPVVVGGFALAQKQSQKNNPQVLAANQVNDIMDKVGKLMDVPEETPTIATVSDISKLSGQEFFAKAQNGDKVIIFPKAQKAILYRPGTDKIIEVAFYTPPEGEAQTSKAPTPTNPISLRDLANPSPRPTNASVSPAPSSAAVSPVVSPAPSINP